jgi:nitrate/TMAO reductase-like tetraheme cytochrome c subunit
MPPPVSAAPTAVTLADELAWGSALDWATTLTLGLAVLIVALIVVSRFAFRGRQAEGTALWVHLLALGGAPLCLLAVGNFAVFEHSKEERFCGSCHRTMKPYIDDLRSPTSQSLAALHSQHRVAPGIACYACHANYGLHGTFEAKRTGLRHAYRYATGTFHLPLTMPAGFDNALCLKCHNRAKRFMAHEIHLDGGQVSAELATNKTGCVECHAPAHSVPGPKTARAGLP